MGINFGVFNFLWIIIWVIYRILNNKKRKNLNIKREVIVNLIFIYFLLVMKITLFKSGSLYIRDLYIKGINYLPFIETIKLFTGQNVSFAILNVAGNIILFMPLGFLIPLLFEKTSKLKKIIFYGVIFSTFIETIQYFTSDNTSDVDDIILNTLGAVLGFCFYRVVYKLLKDRKVKEFIYHIKDFERGNLILVSIKPMMAMVIISVSFIFLAVNFFNIS